jgi:membrane-associated phospholipid phosphatase
VTAATSPPLAVAAWGWPVIALVIVAAGAAIWSGRREAAPAPGARRRFWLTLVFFAIVPAALFAALAVLVFVGGTPSWDLSLLQLAARHQQATARTLVEVYTTLGSLWLVLVLLGCSLVLLVRARLYRQAAFVATATALSMSASGIMKLIFARPRPEVIPQPLGSFSFPSGHTMSATGLAVSLVVVLWPTRWRVPALVVGTVWAVGVGLTRVYLGYHFPSDVLAGWALSLAVVGVTLLGFGGRVGLPRSPGAESGSESGAPIPVGDATGATAGDTAVPAGTRPPRQD